MRRPPARRPAESPHRPQPQQPGRAAGRRHVRQQSGQQRRPDIRRRGIHDEQARIEGEGPGDELATVGFVGDLDGDGQDDLAVGARRNTVGPGRVYFFKGPVAGWSNAADADLILEGGGPGGSVGEEFRRVGDLDGDGLPDLAIGAYLSEETGTNAGSFYLFSGAVLRAALQ